MNGFHAKSLFIIKSYVIARGTVCLATLNLLIGCILTSHIIMPSVVSSNPGGWVLEQYFRKGEPLSV